MSRHEDRQDARAHDVALHRETTRRAATEAALLLARRRNAAIATPSAHLVEDDDFPGCVWGEAPRPA